jgi:hypothetical protein
MRTRKRIAEDRRRLAKCCAIEAAIDKIAEQHPGLSLRELAAKLPADEGEQLMVMLDELEIQSRECSAIREMRSFDEMAKRGNDEKR